MPAALLLIAEGLRFANLMIEGVPPGQRQAQAQIWFWLTWPVVKMALEELKVPQEQIEKIEELAKK